MALARAIAALEIGNATPNCGQYRSGSENRLQGSEPGALMFDVSHRSGSGSRRVRTPDVRRLPAPDALQRMCTRMYQRTLRQMVLGGDGHGARRTETSPSARELGGHGRASAGSGCRNRPAKPGVQQGGPDGDGELRRCSPRDRAAGPSRPPTATDREARILGESCAGRKRRTTYDLNA